MLTNIACAGDYRTDFIIARSFPPTFGILELELLYCTPDELENDFHLWGSDPRMISVFTASDSHSDTPHQLRKY